VDARLTVGTVDPLKDLLAVGTGREGVPGPVHDKAAATSPQRDQVHHMPAGRALRPPDHLLLEKLLQGVKAKGKNMDKEDEGKEQGHIPVRENRTCDKTAKANNHDSSVVEKGDLPSLRLE